MYTYIHICIYIHIYIYIYVHVQKYVYIFSCTYISVCVCIHIYTYVYTYRYTYSYILRNTFFDFIVYLFSWQRDPVQQDGRRFFWVCMGKFSFPNLNRTWIHTYLCVLFLLFLRVWARLVFFADSDAYFAIWYVLAHCKTLQHSATLCNNLLRCDMTHSDSDSHSATGHLPAHCNALHHPASHCNTLQHTATHCRVQNGGAETCQAAPGLTNVRRSFRTGTAAQGLLVCASCWCYGVATVSRIDQIISLFCRILSLL